MSRFGRHFIRIREIKETERRLIQLIVSQPGALHSSHQALYRYAINLAQMNLFRTPDGRDVSVSEDVDLLRRWFIESIVPLIPRNDPADIETLRQIAPVVALRVDETRRILLERHINDFNAEHLDAELRQKKLVMVLGGGGGAGLVHLGAFSYFDSIGVTPELIVGSSMGGVMGLVRALSREYDPMAVALALPRKFDYNTIFRPFTGFSRFGFPGAFHLNIARPAREVFQQLLGTSSPRLSDLPIKLEVVSSGVRKGFYFDERQYEAMAQGDPTPVNAFAMRKKIKLFFNAIKQLSHNPRLLTQVVFGREPGTEYFPVIDALGFSCSVPGLLHFDIFHDDPETIEPLEAMFERHKLLRLCDGGVVNNVPSKVAWESVQSGTIETRNAHIVSLDPFAPVSSGRNIIWIPIQQIARPAVIANKPYSDFHKTFQSPPSPLQIIVNNYSKLKNIVAAARDDVAADGPGLQEALKQLPPYGVWDIDN